MKMRLLVGVVAVGLLVLGLPTPAQAYSSWTLTVEPCARASCAVDFTVDHDKFITDEDNGDVVWTLVGPSGKVKLDDEPLWPTKYNYTNYLVAPLPAGDYTLTVEDLIWGRWHCSIYYKKVCQWEGDDSTTRTFHFTWTGVATTVTSIPSVDAFKIKTMKTRGDQRQGLFMVDTSWDHREPFTIQVRKNGKWATFYQGRLSMGMAFRKLWVRDRAKYRVVTLTEPQAVSRVVKY